MEVRVIMSPFSVFALLLYYKYLTTVSDSFYAILRQRISATSRSSRILYMGLYNSVLNVFMCEQDVVHHICGCCAASRAYMCILTGS